MSTAARLHAILVEYLIDWASERWPDEPVCALGLVYGAGWPPLPTPGILTAAEREELLEEPDEYGVGLMLWNPGEYGIVGVPEFPDEAIKLADELLEIWENDEDWFAFMGGVARALAAHDWNRMATTADFVVFANTSMDIDEQAQLEAQLAMSVHAERLDELRDRGLLTVTAP
jgi:hypothetical protein